MDSFISMIFAYCLRSASPADNETCSCVAVIQYIKALPGETYEGMREIGQDRGQTRAWVQAKSQPQSYPVGAPEPEFYLGFNPPFGKGAGLS